MSLAALQALPHSAGYAITSALLGGIAANALLSGLPLSRNPRRPAHLGKGSVVLVLSDKEDNLVSDPGAAELRRRDVSLGVLCREDDADALADKVYQHLHVAAYDALRLLQQTNADIRALKETGVRFSVEDIEIDGAIVIGGWSIDYRYRRPFKKPVIQP